MGTWSMSFLNSAVRTDIVFHGLRAVHMSLPLAGPARTLRGFEFEMEFQRSQHDSRLVQETVALSI